MSAPRIILTSLLSFCQKLSKLVEIWQSSHKNNFPQFFETHLPVTEVHNVSRFHQNCLNREQTDERKNISFLSHLLYPDVFGVQAEKESTGHELSTDAVAVDVSSA